MKTARKLTRTPLVPRPATADATGRRRSAEVFLRSRAFWRSLSAAAVSSSPFLKRLHD